MFWLLVYSVKSYLHTINGLQQNDCGSCAIYLILTRHIDVLSGWISIKNLHR